MHISPTEAAKQPPGYNVLQDWRYYHGGVANTPAYQLEISAFGYNAEEPALERIYAWYGFPGGRHRKPRILKQSPTRWSWVLLGCQAIAKSPSPVVLLMG